MINLILITGVPGSGKTSVARELAKSLPKSAHICGDEVRSIITGGFKDPANPWEEETREQYYLSFKNEGMLTKNFIGAGFKVIIDDVVHAGDLFREWSKYFIDVRYLKVLLKPSLEEIIRRNSNRGEDAVSEVVIRSLYADFEKENYDDWNIVDTTTLTLAETVEEIRKRIGW